MKSGVKIGVWPPAPIALCSAAQVKTGLGEELIFQVEAGLVDFLILVSKERAKQETELNWHEDCG